MKSWTQAFYIGILIFLLLTIPVFAASNATTGTNFVQTAYNWTQPEGANLSVFVTSPGWVFIFATIEARTNFTISKARARLLEDGIELVVNNITESAYLSNNPIMAAVNATTGQHNYSLELSAPLNRKLIVNNWFFMVNGRDIDDININMVGVGNAYVCVNSNGVLYRSNSTCI